MNINVVAQSNNPLIFYPKFVSTLGEYPWVPQLIKLFKSPKKITLASESFQLVFRLIRPLALGMAFNCEIVLLFWFWFEVYLTRAWFDTALISKLLFRWIGLLSRLILPWIQTYFLDSVPRTARLTALQNFIKLIPRSQFGHYFMKIFLGWNLPYSEGYKWRKLQETTKVPSYLY